jgi:(R,R)-butanediol dehydrogenase / meso-butanediol dehydrogenase / diacetyl reductase
MKAIVYHGQKDLRYEDIPEPPLAPQEVMVKVKYAGMCHTDFNEYENGPIFMSTTSHPRTGRKPPMVLGHEFAGRVVDVGPQVANLRAGDRVAVNAVDACGECYFCRQGNRYLCPTVAFLGFGRDGGFAEFVAVQGECCHPLREGVSYREAVLAEPLSVAVHAVRRSKMEVGADVAIVGGGTLGLCLLQVARACGARDVFVIERSETKRKFCDVFGGIFLNPKTDEKFREKILSRTHGRGVGFAFECAGAVAALETAVDVTASGGVICATGIYPGPFPFDFNKVLSGEKSIVSSLAYGMEYPATIAMLADGRLRAEPLITNCVPLSEGCEHIREFESRGATNIKTLLEIDPQE